MKKNLNINKDHLDIITAVLKLHLPKTATAWVFGSRAEGAIKKFSDIDLLIDTGSPLSLQLTATLANAFDESTLPYKVDIVDACTMSDEFHDQIKLQKIKIFPEK